jgi:hypothetical protein
MEYVDTDELIERLDVEIRNYMSNHQLPQWFVDEMAKKFLNVAYIRMRIRELYPTVFREIAPFIEIEK